MAARDDLESAPTTAENTVLAPPSSDGGVTLRPTGPRTVLPRVEQTDGKVRLVLEPKERYREGKLLGQGGMGKVHVADDQDIGRQVAVKHLLSPDGLARFIQEVRIIGRLEHPNIVPIHDVGVDEQGHFFVMKYLEGETLQAIIARLAAGDAEYHRRYTFERRVQIFTGLLRALQLAHARGVLHRDIKPENVMVGRFGEVMLMDWGVAKVMGEPSPERAGSQAAASGSLAATKDGDLVGTPAYMSPEQARGEHDRLDPRSDLYSAAVVLHELLVLRHYLAGRKGLVDLLMGVCEAPIDSFLSLTTLHRSPHQPMLPPDLIHFLRKGLAKDPADRFQSVEEMLDELQGNVEGKTRVRCAFTFNKRLVQGFLKFSDGHPVLGALSVLLLLAMVGLGVVQLARSLLS